MQNQANKWFRNTTANAMAAIAIGAMLIFSVSGMKAFADNVQDDIDASVSSSQTITAGDNGLVVKYWIVANGQGGFSGCDAGDGSSVTVKFEVRKDGSTALTNDVTATPSSLSFSSCGSENSKSTTYKSDTPGIYKVSVSASDTSGSYNTNPAEFTLTVKAADTTKPVLNLPADITKESTGPTEVTYTATATDDVDGSITPSCDPSSGSTFPLGETTVTCTATDTAGNTATGTFTVTVTKPADTTKPVLSLPSPMTEEATSADGAKVTYTATATDDVDGSITPSCDPSSGSTFPLGETTVTCTATDTAGNTATGSFTVTVQDTTAPELNLPSAPPTEEATSPQGAVVTYTATATDLVDGTFAADCTPSSGSTFALGPTTVTCSAIDKAGNKAEPQSFTITVADTKAPTLTVPADITTKATGVDGAKVTYTATASDVVDTDPTVTCTPSSGSTFPVGPTTVSCTATDDSGNTSPASSFKVTVTLTMKGFYQPVDMPPTVNTVKGGSTVPIKFEIFAGDTELTSTTFNGAQVGQFTAKKGSSCTGTSDAVEVTTTGATSFRYDSTSGTFIQNWKTPTGVACYQVTFLAQDGVSSLAATIQTK